MGIQHSGGNFSAFHGVGVTVKSGGVGARLSGGIGGFHGRPAGVQRDVNFGAFPAPRVGSHSGFTAWHSDASENQGPGIIARNAAVDGRHEGDLRWHKGYWHGGCWHKGWWGPAFVTGVAVGAFATCPSYDGCWVYQSTYDANGNYLGRQCVNVCY
jgi:hypothetical protein